MAATLDDPDYFLRHFDLLCQSVARYRDLLSPGELVLLACGNPSASRCGPDDKSPAPLNGNPNLAHINSAAPITADAKRLLVRLISRRGSCFRVSKLSYGDIGDIDGAIHQLKAMGLVSQLDSAKERQAAAHEPSHPVYAADTESYGADTRSACAARDASAGLKTEYDTGALSALNTSHAISLVTSLVTKAELHAVLTDLLSADAYAAATSVFDGVATHTREPVPGTKLKTIPKPVSQSLSKPLSKSLSKSALCAIATEFELWPAIWAQIAADVIEVDAARHFRTLKLLYFGNSWQDFSEFVVAELGHRRYEAYLLDAEHRRFDSRVEIEIALGCADIGRELDAAKALDDESLEQLYKTLKQLEVLGGDNLLEMSHSARRLGRIRCQLGREFERRGQTDKALSLYQGLMLAPARERAVRCLEGLANYEAAFSAASALFHSPLNDDEYRVSLKMLPRLAKKAGRPWQAPPNYVPPSEQLGLRMAEAFCSKADPSQDGDFDDVEGALQTVEARCVRYYQGQGTAAWHVENGFNCGLFGLGLWDIIFMPVKAAFDHPFQTAPADMYRGDFSAPRQAALKARLDAIRGGDFSILERHLMEKQGIANDWVNWALWTEGFWQQLMPLLKGAWLASLIEHMLVSPKERRSGWPDLLVIDHSELRFVEVKGPGDRLAPHQTDWLKWLNENGMPARVLYVNYLE